MRHKQLRKIYRTFKNLFLNVLQQQKFKKQFKLFNKLNNDTRFENSWSDILPCLNDNTGITNFDAHYIYHPAWAARVLRSINPAKHIDISSTLHFCTLISAFIETAFYDYRPAHLNLEGLNTGKADLNNLHFEDNSIQSLSCMHTIEHIGLGRYGDNLNPNGDLKAIEELKRVCAPGGNLLIVLPVGKKKLMFNAHRIYNADEVIKEFDGFKIIEFSLVTDNNDFITNSDLSLANEQNYGCGCFWFQKNQ